MSTRQKFRLIDALFILLFALLPALLFLGVAEGQAVRPTLVFWLLLLLPMLVLPWLLLCCDPEETENGVRAAGRTVTQKDDDAVERFSEAVAPLVFAKRAYLADGLPVVEGVSRTPSVELFELLDDRLKRVGLTPLVESTGHDGLRIIGLPRGVVERLRSRSSAAVHALLFAATLATTVYAGAIQRGVNLLEEPARFAIGLPYALALLAILGVHELGHYVVARLHGVEVSLPYFIPVPMGLGTFGAFIQMRSLIKSRRAVFDIGIAGPLAGLVVALPVLYFGLQNSSSLARAPGTGVDTASSLLLALVYQLAHGGDLGSVAVQLSPIAFAGWIGLFVTALNLLPVGQLDGGHIAYGLFGRRHARTISVAAVLLMVGLGLYSWPGLLTWALLIALLAGFSHMPALDDVTPPSGSRFALGGFAFLLFLLIVLPVPGALSELSLDSPYL
jgi:membrane-associated protease RseP (regulator of RpoE activity)